ncbi:ABC transporter ATP-binding protein [Pararhizobium gei]|uniref:ABC transporter ATP-binding protein n=1 Tax=Pararhizobium gei TaxID=1395951 RepID=UPI0023DC48FB|nr:ABC transporter ATP-binding protein [Rhizobium gei]
MTEEKIVFQAIGLCVSAVQHDGSETPIVRNVDFAVPKGKIVALIGESGSGKTTISLSALGYCRPGLKFSGGEARLNGHNILKLDARSIRAIRGERVTYVAQSAAAAFNPALRINEQVTEGPVRHGSKTQIQADERAIELYRALELPNPDQIGNRYPHQVSGGQLQRLMAAMALCGDPDLIVLDEPTTALDVTTQIEVLKTFKRVIRDSGAGAIYVTHDLAVVSQIADYIVVLYQGEVQERGTTDAIINNAQHPYTKRLIEAARPRLLKAETNENEPSPAGMAALTLDGVTAGYGTSIDGKLVVPVLREVDLRVGYGKTVGLIGESGCGKSTLARVAAGLLPQAGGIVRLDGLEVAPSYKSRSKEELRKIQFVYQMADTALNPKHTVGEIVGRPVEFYSGLRGAKKRERVSDLLKLVDLKPELAQRYPGQLSGGQMQRVNLARSLAANPEVMLCDEVTSALDSIVSANIVDLLRRLQKSSGLSFVFISHDLLTVSSLADQVAVLYAGSIVEKGPAREVLEKPAHPYTKLLVSSVPEMRIGWLEEEMEKFRPVGDSGNLPSLPGIGCAFFTRCPVAIVEKCNETRPPERTIGVERRVACHRNATELIS